ncbi:hypothetical protein HZA56_00465 [Candidatus Poribacteria bacterium]|nr:hypothetical protein [Candidatus Poribacteria bacterium]
MVEALNVLLGCDVDPDRPRYGGARYDTRDDQLTWRSISEGIQLLQQVLDGIGIQAGVKPKVIFCLRADTQMRDIYGDAAWPITKYADLWRSLEQDGHELAWHPHLWRWSNESGCWYQETEDENWISECLETGHAGFTKALGKTPVTCHMGWTFHNNVSMRRISELGLRVDFSGCPGVFFGGGPGSAGTVFDNKIDWLGTPLRWYRPSEVDYRRPAGGGEAGLSVVEIPKFTTRSGVLRKVKGLAARGKRAPGTGAATAAFLQITSLPMLYSRVIAERLACREADPFFATYFHPDELLADRPRSAKNFLYSLANLEKNVKGLVRAARQDGREVSFVTGAEALEYMVGGTRNSGV